MDGLVGFLNSKRGLLCLALIVAASVLAIMGVFTKEDWTSYTKWIFTAYVVGESATKAVEIHTKGKTGELEPGDAVADAATRGVS